MGIQPPAPYLIAARLGNIGPPKPCQQRPGQHNGSPEPGAFFMKVIAVEVLHIYIIGLKNAGIAVYPVHLYIHFSEQLYQKIYIYDVGDIFNGHFPGCQQNSADDLQGFVLCALRGNVARKFFTATYFKNTHGLTGLQNFS